MSMLQPMAQTENVIFHKIYAFSTCFNSLSPRAMNVILNMQIVNVLFCLLRWSFALLLPLCECCRVLLMIIRTLVQLRAWSRPHYLKYFCLRYITPCGVIKQQCFHLPEYNPLPLVSHGLYAIFGGTWKFMKLRIENAKAELYARKPLIHASCYTLPKGVYASNNAISHKVLDVSSLIPERCLLLCFTST